jgi:hypothetical protein
MQGLAERDVSFFAVEVDTATVPRDADEFARAVVRAICMASVTDSVGRRTYERCLRALTMGATSRLGFRHPGKAEAIDEIWGERHRLFREYRESNDKLTFLSNLPWIGPVTRRRLAWDLGLFERPAEEERRAVA